MKAEAVLLVGCDKETREYLIEFFKEVGYGSFVWANTAEEGEKLLITSSVSFRLAVTEVLLPGKKSGAEFAKWIAEAQPNKMVVVLIKKQEKGAIAVLEKVFSKLQNVAIVGKPFSQNEIVEAISIKLF